jgi:putative transposase
VKDSPLPRSDHLISEYSTPRDLRKLISDYVNQYNNRRLHESLDYETPASWYYSGIAASQAA